MMSGDVSGYLGDLICKSRFDSGLGYSRSTPDAEEPSRSKATKVLQSHRRMAETSLCHDRVMTVSQTCHSEFSRLAGLSWA